MTRLDLAEHHKGGGSGDVGSRPRICPGCGVGSVVHGGADDPVVGRMVFDVVDPMTPTVVSNQRGDHLVGEVGVVLERFASGQFADGP